MRTLWFWRFGSLWWGRSIASPHSFGSETYSPSKYARKVSMWHKWGKKSTEKGTAGCLLWSQTAPPSDSWGLAWKKDVLLAAKRQILHKSHCSLMKKSGLLCMDLLIQKRINLLWLNRVLSCSRTLSARYREVSKEMKNLALKQWGTTVTWDQTEAYACWSSALVSTLLCDSMSLCGWRCPPRAVSRPPDGVSLPLVSCFLPARTHYTV